MAQVLANQEAACAARVQRRMRGLLGALTRWQAQVGDLTPVLTHFMKVTRSYWSGLFHCYDVAGLPRTNNDLEQLFGRYRHIERRITGRKATSQRLVLRGTCRLVAAVATRQTTFTPRQLAPHDVAAWRQLRQQIDTRSHQRRRQLQFRRNPDAFLAQLESLLDQLILLL